MKSKKNILIICLISFAFVFEGVFSNFLKIYSLLSPLFVLMTLIVIYPFLLNEKNEFYKYCFFSGVIYDIVYTDTIIVHGFLFLIIGFLITKINLILANNHINVMVMALIVMVLYRSILYLLLVLTGNVNPSWEYYLQSIYLSIVSNVIYVFILNIVTDKLSIKLKLYKGN